MPPTFRIVAILVLVGAMTPAQALTLYVAPNGSDSAEGLESSATGRKGPLAGLAAALARMGEAGGAPADNETTDRIVLLPGQYTLPATVVVDSRARGASDKPLVISAQELGSVVISGGAELPDFRVEGTVWHSRAASRGFSDLWVNGRRATLARAPAAGKWFQGGSNASKPVAEKSTFAVTQPATIDNTRRLVLAADAADFLRNLTSRPGTSLAGMHLIAMHSWASSRQLIDSYDSARGMLTVSPNGRWPFFMFDRDQRFAFENHLALLDEPGEWWAAGDGAVRYIPRSDESIAGARAVIPRLTTLLRIAGTPQRPLRTVVLRGLRFQYAAAAIAPHVDGQAAPSVSSAVVADYVRGLEIDQCVFEHLGGHALWLRDGVTDSRVRRSQFRDLGAGGLRIGNSKRAGDDAERTARIAIENNRIVNGGLSFPSAVGIWIGQAGDNRIAHNEISDFNYSGISIGWSWNFSPTDSVRNVVEFNHVHDVGRGMLSDLGGIYTLGVSDGTVIRNNLIERVTSWRQSGGSTAFGIYLDAGSSNILVENNVSIGSTGGGFHLHWGRNNVVRNNIFADGLLAQAKRVKSGPEARLTFEENVLAGNGHPIYQGEWSDNDVLTKRNVLSAGAQKRFQIRDRDLRAVQGAGKEEGSVDDDPQLNCDRSGCTISDDATAKTGFKPISLKGVGIEDRGAVLSR